MSQTLHQSSGEDSLAICIRRDWNDVAARLINDASLEEVGLGRDQSG